MFLFRVILVTNYILHTLVLYLDVELSSTSSDCPGDVIKSETEERQKKNCKETVETVWKTVTDLCCSDSLKRFLWKRGRLTSLTVDKGNLYFPKIVLKF